MSGTITICYEMRKNKIGGGEKIEQVGSGPTGTRPKGGQHKMCKNGRRGGR